MNRTLFIFLITLISLFCFSVFIFLFIVFRKIVNKYREKKFRKKYEEIKREVSDILSRGRPEQCAKIGRKYKSAHSVLVRVIFDWMEDITGPERELLGKIFDYCLRAKYYKDLHSRRVVKRLKAARLFAMFSSPVKVPDLFNLFHDRPVVRQAAIKALSQSPTPENISYIFETFEEDSQPNLKTYFDIFFGLGKKIESFVREYLRKPLSEEKLGLLIEVVGSVPLPALVSEICRFSDHNSKEIRIRVAKALGDLALPEAGNELIKLASDKAWEVKAQAIKSLGRLKMPDALQVLREALFSPFWHVRLNAGYSLAEMGYSGIKSLEEVAERSEDKYASQMANMVLRDSIYYRENQ